MKLNEVVFCYGLPLTREQFEGGAPQSDFLRIYAERMSWKEYQDQMVVPYTRLKDFFSARGVCFIDQCSFQEFSDVLNGPPHKVVILMTHCRDGGGEGEALEFSDGLVLSENVLRAIPVQYGGILELGACNPIRFASMIAGTRMDCMLRYVSHNISIIYWMLFYAQLLAGIDKGSDYFKAYKDALFTMLNIK